MNALASSLSVTSSGVRFSLSPRLGSAPISNIILIAATCPCQAAANSGVHELTPAPASNVPWRSSMLSGSAPRSINNLMHSIAPPLQAAHNAVRPCSSTLCILAPASRRASATAGLFLQQAAIRGVLPCSFANSMSAPFSMRKFTASTWPNHEQVMRGVSPSPLVALTSSFSVPNSISKAATCPLEAAMYSEFSPFSSIAVGSAPASTSFVHISA
mmetsp:Transcript_19753/g.37645  ORF Transcript_19753/g.37645 Transcript_19753/m.37645 type:complete len:215 (-) Transcript_19753:634-1278(-)